mgnify:CR=1 FL=1
MEAQTVELTVAAAVTIATKSTIAALGHIDILCNNAGIAGGNYPTWEYPVEEFRRVIDVDLNAVFICCRAVAPHLRERGYGRIINTASPSGIYGNVGQTNYGAAKAGIAAFSIIAAQELVKYGVTVNCLAPTAWSRMTAPLMGGDDAPDHLKEQISPRWIAVITAWLASPEAANVTGRCFDIRGDQLGIAEGWHLGPVATQTDDPGDMGPVVAELMSKARLNAAMSGKDHEGHGFPSQSI